MIAKQKLEVDYTCRDATACARVFTFQGQSLRLNTGVARPLNVAAFQQRQAVPYTDAPHAMYNL